MKKIFFYLIIFFITFSTFAQQKYALVIGNSEYKYVGSLRNPGNDADDIAEALNGLGFTVEIVHNGSLDQMEKASIRLKNRLTAAGSNAYGFFYYSGHGLQLDGINYLIPSNANIPEKNFIRERAFPVQVMLDMLNDSRNALNIIVLDACRSYPTSWSRNNGTGLSVISNPPANHIIMFATGAGKEASDGSGRNGLFTTHLLNNLKTTDIDVNEVFRRTMGDVSRASNGEQRPALYTDFSEPVYLGTRSQSGTYKIGDRGPAGGIIFYDKGNSINGWRYLEVSPSNTEFRAQWGAYEKNVSGTSTEIGSGKRNTQLIIDFLKTTGETGKAAHLCANLNFGGFNDWFLPSRDELDLLYKNLRNKNLGNFVTKIDVYNDTHIYWSSSQYNPYVSWFHNFNDGFQNYASTQGKSDSYSVRAIRAF